MRKYLLSGILGLSLIFVNCLPAPVITKQVQVNMIKQATNNWCWAATLGMVAEKYKNIPIRDCDIVTAVDKFYIEGSPFDVSNFSCCRQATNDLEEYFCDRGGSIWDLFIALDYILMIDREYVNGIVTFEKIQEVVNREGSIIVGREFITNGHAHLIIGYNLEKGTVIIAEPTPGEILEVKYSDFVGSLQWGIWQFSIIINDKPAKEPKCSYFCADDECKTLDLACLPN